MKTLDKANAEIVVYVNTACTNIVLVIKVNAFKTI